MSERGRISSRISRNVPPPLLNGPQMWMTCSFRPTGKRCPGGLLKKKTYMGPGPFGKGGGSVSLAGASWLPVSAPGQRDAGAPGGAGRGTGDRGAAGGGKLLNGWGKNCLKMYYQKHFAMIENRYIIEIIKTMCFGVLETFIQ